MEPQRFHADPAGRTDAHHLIATGGSRTRINVAILARPATGRSLDGATTDDGPAQQLRSVHRWAALVAGAAGLGARIGLMAAAAWLATGRVCPWDQCPLGVA